MKRLNILTFLGLAGFVTGCGSLPQIGSNTCEAINMTRAEYDAYEALGPDKPYYCAINVPRAVPDNSV